MYTNITLTPFFPCTASIIASYPTSLRRGHLGPFMGVSNFHARLLGTIILGLHGVMTPIDFLKAVNDWLVSWKNGLCLIVRGGGADLLWEPQAATTFGSLMSRYTMNFFGGSSSSASSSPSSHSSIIFFAFVPFSLAADFFALFFFFDAPSLESLPLTPAINASTFHFTCLLALPLAFHLSFFWQLVRGSDSSSLASSLVAGAGTCATNVKFWPNIQQDGSVTRQNAETCWVLTCWLFRLHHRVYFHTIPKIIFNGKLNFWGTSLAYNRRNLTVGWEQRLSWEGSGTKVGSNCSAVICHSGILITLVWGTM